MVAQGSLMQKEFNQKQLATMGSFTSLAGSILFGIFSILLGFVADRSNVAVALVLANLTLFIPLLFYRKVFTKD